METAILILRITEGLAFITGLVYWKKWKETPLQYLTFYLLWIVAVEFFGAYTLSHNMISLNNRFFNWIATPVEFLFFYFFFYFALKGQISKINLLLNILFFIGFWLGDQLFLSHKKFFFTSAGNNVGTILLLIVVVQYFLHLVKSSQLLRFYDDPLFWVSCGVVIFYFGTLPYYGMYNTLVNKYRSLFDVYKVVVAFLSATMYLFFTIAFIWGKRR